MDRSEAQEVVANALREVAADEKALLKAEVTYLRTLRKWGFSEDEAHDILDEAYQDAMNPYCG